MRPLSLTLLTCLACAVPALASDLLEARPLTDRIVLLHFNDGHVIHHKRGQKRADEKVVTDPLDTKLAGSLSSYNIKSKDDRDYIVPLHPMRISRKSKGTDFAWFVDRWADGRAVNDRPDHTDEHWVCLFLPLPMKTGRTYEVETGALAKNGHAFPVRFDETAARSEAVHVNLLGYVPTSKAKYGYVY